MRRNNAIFKEWEYVVTTPKSMRERHEENGVFPVKLQGWQAAGTGGGKPQVGAGEMRRSAVLRAPTGAVGGLRR